MTQRQLAALVGISQGSVSRIEGDGSTDAMDSTIQRLAHALRTSIAYLRGETDDPAPPSAGDPVTTSERPRDEALEDALGIAFRKHPHAQVRDLDTVRDLLLTEALPHLDNLEAAVGVVLDACVSLRSQSQPQTLHSVLMYTLRQFANATSPSASTKATKTTGTHGR